MVVFYSYSASEGLLCLNAEQTGGRCEDYKVMFTCSGHFCSGVLDRETWRVELCFSSITSLISSRVQDTLVWPRWPDRKWRLWGHQWPPQQVPQGDLPPAHRHRGPDCLWRTGLQHVRHLFKVRLTTSSLQQHEERVQHFWCCCSLPLALFLTVAMTPPTGSPV